MVEARRGNRPRTTTHTAAQPPIIYCRCSESPNNIALLRAAVVCSQASPCTRFLQFEDEELDFILGRATVARGLEVGLSGVRAGQCVGIVCGAGFGYPSLRRPKVVPPDAILSFRVTLLRYDVEQNPCVYLFESMRPTVAIDRWCTT